MSAPVQCPTHGVSCRSAYGEKGCRCKPCVDWKIAANAEYRARKKAAAIDRPNLPPVDVSTVEAQEAMWTRALDAFMTDLNYLADMMEASVPIAQKRGEL